jgi:hypothetical protein
MFAKFLIIIVKTFAETEMLDNFREKENVQDMNMRGCNARTSEITTSYVTKHSHISSHKRKLFHIHNNFCPIPSDFLENKIVLVFSVL